ncbi:MAG: aminotransferase class IV [Bacteroidales bacterium]|nr:aminotransferase class IV [Bacteroidales bacterium]
MSQLFETIRLENGRFFNLEYHQQRMNKAYLHFFPGRIPFNLEKFLSEKEFPHQGLYRCRMDYNGPHHSVEFHSYKRRIISSLQLVCNDEIEYSYKYSNREVLQQLLLKKNNCDEIIIVKNGLLTDTTFSNLIFFDGSNWYTPSIPLLNGTKRQFLLNNGLIQEKDISPQDLKSFHSVCLINAMLDLNYNDALPIQTVSF